MKDKWFINKDGQNLGPFSNKRLLRLKEEGQIKPFTLCWKKGMSEWRPFFEVEELYLVDVSLKSDLPPLPPLSDDLPPVPMDSLLGEEKKDKLRKESRKNKSQLGSKLGKTLQDSRDGFLELVPDIPQDNFSKVEVEAKSEEQAEEPPIFEDTSTPSLSIVSETQEGLNNISLGNEDDSNYSFEEEMEEEEVFREPINYKARFSLMASLVGAAGACCILFITFLIFSSEVKHELTFKNVSLEVLKKLQNVKTRVEKGGKYYINLGLDKSGEVIFGSSNLIPAVAVKAKFELIGEDKSLEDQVSFISSAISKNGSLKFDDFVFTQGNKIKQGKYKVKVEANLKDPLAVVRSYFLGKERYFSYEDEVLLIPGSKKEYEEYLQKIKFNEIQKKKDKLSDLDEKVKTIGSLVTSIALHYRVSLGERNGPASSKAFESRYTQQAGPLLQNIILTDYADSGKAAKDEIYLQETNEEILNLSKKVSAWSVELSSKLNRYGRLNKRKRKKLKAFMSDKKSLLQDEIKKIRDSIQSRKKSITL